MRRALLLALLAGCGGGSPGALADAGAGAMSDGSVSASDAIAAGDADAASRCMQTPDRVSCPLLRQSLALAPGVTRDVYYQVPIGPAPVNGWSVVLLFQGSFASPAITMQATASEPFGAYYQVLLVKRLLDAGYAVIAPAAHAGGSTFWDTNVPPWDAAWSGSPDDELMVRLFAAMDAGTFGPLDSAHRYATGISSGGYMTSRMAVSYAGRFRALVIASASYATCSGPLCNVPEPLPADHPPTLFLHGGADPVVPPSTMMRYRDALAAEGHPVDTVIDPAAGHQWLAAAPDSELTWFNTWR